MKVKVKKISFEELTKIKVKKDHKPVKPNIFWRTLIKLVSLPDILATKFKANYIDMDKLSKKEPCLILMNHSAFLDLEIAETVLYPRPFNIVCTYDGFIGKNWLMYQIGCIPTKKFITDSKLVRDMMHCIKKQKTSVLMYPEAGYTFDGCKTTMPDSLGKLVKMLDVPVVTIITYGSFHRQPLYNNLNKRKIKAKADIKYLLSKADIDNKTEAELNQIIHNAFSFDQFKWQQDNRVLIKEENRAEGLERVLYQCPHCLKEGKMHGTKSILKCEECGIEYELTEDGYLKALNGETKFNHVPDWYNWERTMVREELIADKYHLDCECDVCAMVDTYSIYSLGKGRLIHDKTGLTLFDEEQKLIYHHPWNTSYTVNADFYWYQIADTVSIGDRKGLYYCFPKNESVTKIRLAAEELYKMKREKTLGN